MKVLAVHDSENLRLPIEQAVLALGHELNQVATGQAALDYMAENAVDLLIIDADMPVAGGCKTAGNVRRLQKNWFPVVFLIAELHGCSNGNGILAGADAYLTKPLSLPLLQAQIAALEKIYRMQLASLTAHRELQLLLEATVDGILTTDEEGRIQAANRAVEKIFGYSFEEIKGCNVSLLNADQEIVKGRSNVEGRYYEILAVRKNGERFPIEIDVSHYAVDSKFYYLSVMRDISERKEAERKLLAVQKKLVLSNKKLEKLSFFDQLTGLANRRNFDTTLERELRLARREKTLLSLIICDIDFFKLYNDHYGHQAGDACLQQIAAVLGSIPKRPADLACRYGGEEFTVILPRTDVQGVAHLAEKIRMAVQNSRISHAASKITDCVTLSLGLVTYTGQFETAVTLLKAADDALYRAKEQGRNRFASA
jgi:diguanylate cyclase (GGDEF)-like protein/PAS domain S-box-containing protein